MIISYYLSFFITFRFLVLNISNVCLFLLSPQAIASYIILYKISSSPNRREWIFAILDSLDDIWIFMNTN